MKCKDHPKYTAVLIPRCACLTCWIMYEKTMTLRLAAVKTEIKELRYGK